MPNCQRDFLAFVVPRRLGAKHASCGFNCCRCRQVDFLMQFSKGAYAMPGNSHHISSSSNCSGNCNCGCGCRCCSSNNGNMLQWPCRLERVARIITKRSQSVSNCGFLIPPFVAIPKLHSLCCMPIWAIVPDPVPDSESQAAAVIIPHIRAYLAFLNCCISRIFYDKSETLMLTVGHHTET